MRAQDWIALAGVLLSWPVAALVIVTIYRRELRTLLKQARRFSAGPLTVEPSSGPPKTTGVARREARLMVWPIPAIFE